MTCLTWSPDLQTGSSHTGEHHRGRYTSKLFDCSVRHSTTYGPARVHSVATNDLDPGTLAHTIAVSSGLS